MKKFLAMALVFTATSAAQADICGIVGQSEGRAAAQMIKAQAALSQTKQATLIDDMTGKSMQVVDATVSTKLFANLDGKNYYEMRVTKANGKEEVVDIGHLYLKLFGTTKAVSLNALTGCGIGVTSSKAIIDLE